MVVDRWGRRSAAALARPRNGLQALALGPPLAAGTAAQPPAVRPAARPTHMALDGLLLPAPPIARRCNFDERQRGVWVQLAREVCGAR